MQRREFITNTGVGLAGSLVFNDTLANTLFSTTTYEQDPKPKSAKYIWIDKEGKGRNIYANFRKSFNLKTVPNEAIINLFADSSYQLFVNNRFVHQGPIRFDPRFPVYDSINLAPYLTTGENVIAVQANYFGMKTYKSIPNIGGFVAWGTVTNDKETISLDTSAANWKASPAGERSMYANKLSFALNPADRFEQSKEEKGWKNIGFSDKNWKSAVEIANQSAWGILASRRIPYFKYNEFNDEVEVHKILPLNIKEDVYSFEVPVPDFFDDEHKSGGFVAFKTWIYSEKEQDVYTSTFWGEFWLNGQPVEDGLYSENQNLRITRKFSLKAGWNYYMGKIGPYFDLVDHLMGFPKESGVKISATKDTSTDIVFKRSPLLKKDIFDKFLAPKQLPFAENDDLKEVGGWVDVKSDEKSQSPVFATCWDTYGEPFELCDYKQLKGKKFLKKEYPNGFTIILDLAYTRLLYPILQLSGVKGATIDVCFSEQVTEDNLHLFQMAHYQNGDRVICSEDAIEYMPPHPRGMRFINITVRNTQTDVVFNNLELRSANYPVELKGTFKCSDPLLNEIWQMCLRTQTTNMEDVYVDCVGRERGMYVRDTIIQYFNNLASFGDQELMRRCMELYGQSPDSTGKIRAVFPNSGNYTIADFCLNAVEGFKAYYDHSGDKELINKYWNAIMKNLAWFDELSNERPNDLLLNAEWNKVRGIKSHYGGFHGDLGIKRGYLSIKGIHCIFSLNYLIAMQCAFAMANEIGKTKDAEYLGKRIDFLSKSINENFWDEAKGCYTDNLAKESYSAHASLFAVSAGIVSPVQLEKIKKYVRYEFRSLFVNGFSPEDGTYISPSYCFYMFDGLYKADLTDIAEKLMKDGWGWALTKGYKTVPEYFEKRTQNSLCHAWSASPMYYLSSNVLGVHFPKAPDTNYVEIKVKTDIATDAEGKFPHPKGGTVDVKWHMENGKRVFDYVKAPNGVKVKIIG